MTNRSALTRIDWGHLALLALLAVVTAWYLYDAWAASSRVRNLILVLPASLFSLALATGIAAAVLYRGLTETGEEVDPKPGKPLRERVYPLILMGIFAFYILTLPVLGFDVGSGLFVLIALIADGERRPIFLLGYSAAFAALCTVAFRWLLPYTMHTVIL